MTYWDKATQEQRLDANGWQDIASAPRHYKPIHACNIEKGYEGIVAHNGSEWVLISHDGFPMGIGFYPTHWRPLAPLPKPPSNPFNALLPEASRMSISVVEILKEARKIISDEKNWTQGTFARDAGGKAASIRVGDCFCSVGAIAKVTDRNLIEPCPRQVLDALGVRSHAELARFNDSHKHAEVLNLFDLAIARAEGGAA